MLPDDIPLLWILSVSLVIPLVLLILGCVCGCKKSVPKNELLGLAGMVKLTNPDENVNYTPPAINTPKENSTPDINHDSDSSRRIGSSHFSVGVSSTATRSLPDLPVDQERSQLEACTLSSNVVWEQGEQNNSGGDTGSELYATVGDNKTGDQKGQRKYNNHLSLDRKSGSFDSPSQTDDSMSPYARVKGENPYYQLKKSEHPYAQVGDKSEATQASCSGVSPRDQDEIDGGGNNNPVPSPGHKSSCNNSEDELGSSRSNSVQDIPAATAITGGIAASHELPYMTPPLSHNTVQQPHFSGDSQDSSKGYTSISVREPIANIMGERTRRLEMVDSHYATVSDDSDEMYAAIDEPLNQVYTSGSETYAQIQPTLTTTRAEVESLNLSQASPSNVIDPPQPPSVNSLKHASANVHSRQASSSSCTSSVTNVGSPKPEKRQANSPLPRPPETVDEMYAKVIKKRKETISWSSSRDSICISDQDISKMSRQSIGDLDKFTSNHDRLLKLQSCNLESDKVGNETEIGTSSFKDQIPGYETVSDQNTSVGYLTKPNPGYETVNASFASGYNEMGSDVYQEVGYEEIHKSSLIDVDPNYEELKPQPSQKYNEASYAKVNKAKKKLKKLIIAEPDYASLTRDKSEHLINGESNYESIGREIAEPNYESVVGYFETPDSDNLDDAPNYETVKSTVPIISSDGAYSKVNKIIKKNNNF